MSDGFTRADEEPLACMGESDAPMMAYEKSGPDFVFQIPDTPTYGGLTNIQCLSRTPKAAALGGGNNISKMA